MSIFAEMPDYYFNDPHGAEKDIRMIIKKYFDDKDVILTIKPNINKFSIIAMGKMKKGLKDDDFKNEISSFCSIEKKDIDLKIEYERINPDFKPNKKEEKKIKSDEYDYERLSYNYIAIEPKFTFDNIVLSESTVNKINDAINIFKVEHKVFDEWGLREMIPEAAAALNFYGAPGTGKSMAAEAIASKLGKKIIKATYADIESKYVGEGPKMVKAIFLAAERQDAVLFLDESDSLLSKRLTNVTDGSAQSINSMRSQLLICLENFKGVVIFASNLVVNYDKAFLSRLINIEFSMPNKDERCKIWWKHLKTDKINVPLSNDANIDKLAELYEFNGRQIKNAVKNACIKAAINNQEYLTMDDFVNACETVKNESDNLKQAIDQTKI